MTGSNAPKMLAASYGDGEDGGGGSNQEAAGHYQPVQQQGARAVAVSHMLSRWLPTKGDSGRQVGTEREGERGGEQERVIERASERGLARAKQKHPCADLVACTPAHAPAPVLALRVCACVCIVCVCVCIVCVRECMRRLFFRRVLLPW